MNIEELADILRQTHRPSHRTWDDLGQVEREDWLEVAQAAQNALSQPPVNPVDQDLGYNILALQREVEQLKARLDSVESLTRPIGNAKVRGEELFSTGKAALDLTSRIISKKGTW